MFLALMATGVFIVMIYIWSGESIAALILSIMTLFAALAIYEWKPWAVDGGVDRLASRGERATVRSRVGANRSPRTEAAHRGPNPVWRSRFDITWDQRGVSGVSLGGRAPQLWSWSQVDDISQAWCTAIDEQDKEEKEVDDGIDERIGLCLDFPSLRNPEEPVQAQVMFGPSQDPDTVLTGLRAAWRDSKVTRSRLYDLSPEQRTRRMADDFAGQTIDLTDAGQSPELLYQEIRRALLSGGELCRLLPDTEFDEVLDCFDRLLEANGVEALSQAEAEELSAADGPDRVASLHWTLDWVAEQRGFRMAFIDHGGEDYLIGLVAAQSADDWDGQTIGSGKARVVLDLPT